MIPAVYKLVFKNSAEFPVRRLPSLLLPGLLIGFLTGLMPGSTQTGVSQPATFQPAGQELFQQAWRPDALRSGALLSTAPLRGTLQPGDGASLQDTLAVREFVLSKDVVEREPVEVVESYTLDDEQAWAFARIRNTGDMHTVYFKWFHEEEPYFTMDSQIGTSDHWRTYSSVTLQPGSWRVEIRNEDREKLEEIRFHVAGDPPEEEHEADDGDAGSGEITGPFNF